MNWFTVERQIYCCVFGSFGVVTLIAYFITH